jgi:DNA-binding SARP family transcriptional activator
LARPWQTGSESSLCGTDVPLRALECYAHACLGVGSTELAATERAGRELIARDPDRETGYRHLMQAHVHTGNTAEALHVYEQLRTSLRDELGVAPSTEETLDLHAALLSAGLSTAPLT